MSGSATFARPSVLVTGGARRLGAEIAREFARAGWHVIVHYRNSEKAARALADSLPDAETIGCDLADDRASAAMVRSLADRLEDWRALVNCAAIFELDTAGRIDPALFSRAMQTNAAAPVMLAQRFLRHARAEGGRRVINLLDQKLANPNPDFFSYTMAKAALASATRMLAMARWNERRADRVYGLAPGAMLPSHDQAEAEHGISGRMNLLARLTDPAELAQAAVFLAGGTLASGQVIHVDSGQHLMSQPRDVLFLARADARQMGTDRRPASPVAPKDGEVGA